MLLAYWSFSAFFYQNFTAVRDHIRWPIVRHSYKASLLAKPAPHSSEFRHAEWDVLGYMGAESESYLVYDPKNTLALPASKG